MAEDVQELLTTLAMLTTDTGPAATNDNEVVNEMWNVPKR